MNIVSFALTLPSLVTCILKPGPRTTKSGKMGEKKLEGGKDTKFHNCILSSPSDLRIFFNEVCTLGTLRFDLSTQSFKQLSQFFQLSPHMLGETSISTTTESTILRVIKMWCNIMSHLRVIKRRNIMSVFFLYPECPLHSACPDLITNWNPNNS